MPPLRIRTDFDALVGVLLRELCGNHPPAIDPEVRELFRQYSWPGNLRELRNVIERAVILSDGPLIGVSDLSESVHPSSEIRLGGRFTLEEIEAEHIRRLVANPGPLEEVAKLLGIDPATLYRKRKRL